MHAKPPEIVSVSGDRRLSGPLTRQSEPEQLPCPRCNSTNTKFCYYNNYNLLQPRHFCKSCRRYWTRGGALRNVPVGGGSRKPSASNKRPRSATSTPVTTDGTSSSSSSLVSVSQENDVFGQIQTLDPVVWNSVSGSMEAAAGNINEAAPAKSGGLSCWWSSGEMGVGGELLPGLGLLSGLGYEHGLLNWPTELVDGGDAVVSGDSPGRKTWQMGGDAEGGGKADGDYFSWPGLAISNQPELSSESGKRKVTF